MQRSIRITGVCCCLLAGLLLLPAIPMHCIRPALGIAGVAFVAGVLLGIAMAAITRSRRPTTIYLLLVAAAITAMPLYQDWPSAFAWNMLAYRGPVNRVFNYLEALRPLMYLLGMPFPYAWLGQHGPDSAPDGKEPKSGADEINTPDCRDDSPE